MPPVSPWKVWTPPGASPRSDRGRGYSSFPYLESGYAVELLTDAPSHFGYLLKYHLAEGTVLVDALTRVAAGECLVDPAVVGRLVTHPQAGGPLAPLSAREIEVLSMVAQGLANPTIAGRLDMSRRTLESHVRQIFIKLGISPSRAMAIAESSLY